MKNLHKYILMLLIGILLGSILSINSCNKKPNTIIEYETVISHTRDTIYVPKEIYIKEDQSSVRIDENNTYDSSKHSNKYYQQTFTDSNYVLNTFGRYVDSIDLTIKYNDVYIYDSVKIKETIKETVFVESNELWLSGNINYHLLYKVSPEVRLTYNMKKIGINAGIGYMNGIYFSGGLNIRLK